jgi:arsenite-transporting ATPase
MRILVYTGKGGVGKTSIAAATGVSLARRGQRTLVLSTDAAHSLGDSFDQPLGPEPVQVADNLWGQEIDSLREAERSWGAVQRWLAGVLHWAQVSDINSEEVLVFPGFEELFSLLQILEHARGHRFDVLVVDCAPTGETLRLLSYPNVIRWWLNKVFPFQRRVAKVMRPVAKLVTGGLEPPSEEALDSIDHLFRQVEEMNGLLLDPALTSVRVVLNPEKMVLAEARRSFTYLNLYGFNTDAVVVNRVLPQDAADSYFALWRNIQSRYEEEIESAFSPLPVLHVPWMETEVVGLPMLERVAAAAFAGVDPAGVLHTGRVEEVRRDADAYVLDLAVPFAARDDIQLSQRADELTIQVGPFKRKTLLPRVLAGRPVAGARFVDQRLQVRFGERPAAVAVKGG